MLQKEIWAEALSGMLWDYIVIPQVTVNSKMECLRKNPYFQW